jgi:hypothetical protein
MSLPDCFLLCLGVFEKNLSKKVRECCKILVPL